MRLLGKIQVCKNVSVCTLFILLSLIASSQNKLKWKLVNSEYGYLPKSVNIYKTTDSLNGRPFVAYYIEARLGDRNLEYTTQTGNGKRYTPAEFYAREDEPYVLVNTSFFSFQTNQNLGLAIRNGKMISYNVSALKAKEADSFYYPTRAAFGISKKRKADVAWVFTDSAKKWPYAFQQNPIIAKGVKKDPSFEDLNTLDYWKWWRMYTAMGGGPVLIQKSKIRITNKEEQIFTNGDKDLQPRTAMGYTKKNKLIILVIEGRNMSVADGATLNEESKILLQLHCIEALNFDGGGSSCLLVNGKETTKPSDKEGQRPLSAVFMIKSKKTINIY